MSLALREYFWDDWGPTPPPSGQVPSGSRYRGGYRVDYITGLSVLLMVLLW